MQRSSSIRSLSIIVCLAVGFAIPVASAEVALGDLEVRSQFGEPLDARISIIDSRGLNPADFRVRFVDPFVDPFEEDVPEESLSLLGRSQDNEVEGPLVLTEVELRLQRARGSLEIVLSTRVPVEETRLDFSLAFGRNFGDPLVRDYEGTIRRPPPPSPPVEESISDIPEVAETTEAQEELDELGELDELEALDEIEGREHRTEFGTVIRPSPGFVPRTGAGETPKVPTGNIYSGDYYNLWTIAKRIRARRDLSLYPIMLAVLELNPGAFVDGNVNFLKSGHQLQIPTEEQIRLFDRTSSIAEIARQNQLANYPDVDLQALNSGLILTDPRGGLEDQQLEPPLADALEEAADALDELESLEELDGEPPIEALAEPGAAEQFEPVVEDGLAAEPEPAVVPEQAPFYEVLIPRAIEISSELLAAFQQRFTQWGESRWLGFVWVALGLLVGLLVLWLLIRRGARHNRDTRVADVIASRRRTRRPVARETTGPRKTYPARNARASMHRRQEVEQEEEAEELPAAADSESDEPRNEEGEREEEEARKEGGDSVEMQLDLARAYLEMDDLVPARQILRQALGNRRITDIQRREATELLAKANQ